jgi:hypothetical protein
MTLLRKMITAMLALALLSAVPFAGTAAGAGGECFMAAQSLDPAGCGMKLSGMPCERACPSGSCAATSKSAQPPVVLPAVRALTPTPHVWRFQVRPPETAPPRFASV